MQKLFVSLNVNNCAGVTVWASKVVAFLNHVGSSNNASKFWATVIEQDPIPEFHISFD